MKDGSAVAALMSSGSSLAQVARPAIEAAVLVYAMPHHSDEDAWFVQHFDGRVFLVLASRCREFAREDDADALPAFNRAFASNPGLFSWLEKPEAPPQTLESDVGMIQDLTPADRARLRRITEKHWRFYFASPPSRAQIDQLIDALGVEVATKLAKKAVDGGRIS